MYKLLVKPRTGGLQNNGFYNSGKKWPFMKDNFFHDIMKVYFVIQSENCKVTGDKVTLQEFLLMMAYQRIKSKSKERLRQDR